MVGILKYKFRYGRLNVARGMLVSSSELTKENKAVFLSPFIVSRIIKEKGKFWNLELGLEELRRDKFPDKVSRLNGLFVFHSEAEADKAERLAITHFKKMFLSELLPIETGIFSKHDMNLITYFFEEEGQRFPVDWQCQYWSRLAMSILERYPLSR